MYYKINSQNLIQNYGMMNGLSHVMYTAQTELSKSFKFENNILNAIWSLILSSMIAYIFMHGATLFKYLWEIIEPILSRYYYICKKDLYQILPRFNSTNTLNKN